jgi:hypothetical protein
MSSTRDLNGASIAGLGLNSADFGVSSKRARDHGPSLERQQRPPEWVSAQGRDEQERAAKWGRGHQNTKRDLSAIHGIRRPPSDGRRRIMKQEGRRVVTRSRSPSSASVASYWGRDENANRVETITGLANFGKGSLLGAFSQLGERFGLARNNLIVVSRNQRRSCWQRQQRPPQAAGQRSIQQLL